MCRLRPGMIMWETWSANRGVGAGRDLRTLTGKNSWAQASYVKNQVSCCVGGSKNEKMFGGDRVGAAVAINRTG